MIEPVRFPEGWFLADVKKASQRHREEMATMPSAIVAKAREMREAKMNHIADTGKMVETITGVAIISSDGRMIALPAPKRHCHLFALSAFMGGAIEDERQGFVTSKGRFVDRHEARQIAQVAKQVDLKLGDVLLYSEDLW